MTCFRLLALALPLFLLGRCGPGGKGADEAGKGYYLKSSEKTYAPDQRCYLTIVEHGLDSTQANTQVMLTFKTTGAGIYTVRGIHKALNVSWDNDSTITIRTRKDYTSLQKATHVTAFNGLIRINYLEASAATAPDSLCTAGEILYDRHRHFSELFATLAQTDSSFSQIAFAFRHHITDTLTTLRSQNRLLLNLGKDFALELHIKGLNTHKHIPFDRLKAHNIEIVQYYHGPHTIKDDELGQ